MESARPTGRRGIGEPAVSALLGIAIAALLWWALKTFGRADPKALARLAKMAGGVAALAVAAVLGARGRLDMAALAGGAGAWLLGWSATPPGWMARYLPAGFSARAGGPVSRVRSATIEVELDQGSGEMAGTVIAGPQAGRPLSSFDLPGLLALRRECSARDVEGTRLVEAYLDRRFAGWREHAERDPDGGRRSDPERGPMTEKEAHEVLGLQPGAGPDAVRAAHRTLIKKLHPDGGGSTYLASRVNQAKDVLLDRHR